MTVNELKAQLEQIISAGRGDKPVMVRQVIQELDQWTPVHRVEYVEPIDWLQIS